MEPVAKRAKVGNSAHPWLTRFQTALHEFLTTHFLISDLAVIVLDYLGSLIEGRATHSTPTSRALTPHQLWSLGDQLLYGHMHELFQPGVDCHLDFAPKPGAAIQNLTSLCEVVQWSKPSAMASSHHSLYTIHEQDSYLCKTHVKNGCSQTRNRDMAFPSRCMIAADDNEVVVFNCRDRNVHAFDAQTLAHRRENHISWANGEYLALHPDILFMSCPSQCMVLIVDRKALCVNGFFRPVKSSLDIPATPGPVAVVGHELFVMTRCQSLNEIQVFTVGGQFLRIVAIAPTPKTSATAFYSLCTDGQRLYVGVTDGDRHPILTLD